MSTNEHDDEPEPTEDELRAAAELARALDEKRDPAPGSDAAFAESLRATRGLAPKLEPNVGARAVDRAIARGSSTSRTRVRVRWLAVAAAALIAVGIPVGLAWQTQGPGDLVVVAPVAQAFGGPTDTIFDGPFADDQRASERMDRIASVRAHDYFAAIAASEAR